LRSLQKWALGVLNGSINTHRLDHFKFEEDIVKTGKIEQVLDKRHPIWSKFSKNPSRQRDRAYRVRSIFRGATW
jgi:hypothetical protein